MTKAKKLAALVLVFTMLVWMSSYAGAVSFSDTAGTPYDKAVSELNGLNILGGYPDGTFKPANPVTRAELAKILVTALGYGATADMLKNVPGSFSDVKVGDWYNGYVAVAASLGVVKGYPDGTFHPNDNVSYQDALVMMLRAGGFDAQAQAAGGYPDGYLAVGTQLGFTTGTAFTAGLPATRGDIALMADFLVFKAKNPTTGKTLAESVFRIDQTAPVITLAGADNGKTYNSPVIPIFVANEGTVTATLSKDGGAPAAFTSGTAITDAGSYVLTVTATDAAGNSSTVTASFTLDVWGEAAALKIEGPASVVANDASKYDYTVKVVDKDGNLVKNYDGYVKIDKAQDQGAVVFVDPTTGDADPELSELDLNVNDGTATFKVRSTEFPDATDTLQATLVDRDGYDLEGFDPATFDVTSAAQVATSLKVTSDRDQLSADGESYANVTATVLDQAGKKMLSGSYELTFKVSGPGAWGTDGSDDPKTEYAMPDVTVKVYTVLEDEGTITVTVSGEGLGSAATTIGSFITLSPAKIVVVADPTTIAADGSMNDGSITFYAKLLDRNGHLVTVDDQNITLTVDKKHRHTLAFDASITTYTTAEATDRGIASFTGYAFGNELGAATLTATATVGSKDISGSTTVQLVAGDPVEVSFGDLDYNGPYGGDPVFLSASNPKATITAQLVDDAGNPVAQSGVTVYFDHLYDGPGADSNGHLSGLLNASRVTSDANGKVSVVANLPAYYGTSATISASLGRAENGTLVDPIVSTREIVVLDSIATTASVKLDIVNTTDDKLVTSIVAGDSIQFRATLKDVNGTPVEEKPTVYMYFDADPSTAIKAQWDGTDGYYYVDETVASSAGYDLYVDLLTAGRHTVTVVDAGMLNSPTATRALYVAPDEWDHFVVLDSDGNEVTGDSYDEAGVYGPYTLELRDLYDNVTIATADVEDIDLGLSASNGNAEIRLKKDGAPVSLLKIPAGRSSVTFYVAVDEAADVTFGLVAPQ